MGKAYTREEREAKKIALMESAIALFHENGSKSLNIRELTKRAGISQGGFYTFWEDKDALILDVIKYRAGQKLDMLVPLFPQSLKDPKGFLTHHIYAWCIDMKEKIKLSPLYANSMKLLRRSSPDEIDRISAVYSDFLSDLADYWLQNGALKNVEISGLVSLLSALGVLLNDHVQFEDEYLNELLKLLIDGAVDRYITL